MPYGLPALFPGNIPVKKYIFDVAALLLLRLVANIKLPVHQLLPLPALLDVPPTIWLLVPRKLFFPAMQQILRPAQNFPEFPHIVHTANPLPH